MAKAKTAPKKIRKLIHAVLHPDSINDETKALYTKKKLTPKEYVNLLTGAYGTSPYDLNYNLQTQNSIHSQNEKYNDAAIKKLRDHIRAAKDNDEHSAGRYIENILEKHPVSESTLKAIIKNPKGYGFESDGDLHDAIYKQKNISKDMLMGLATNPERSLGRLINHPNVDSDVTKALLSSKPDKVSGEQMRHMLSTTLHDDPKKRLIDNDQIEDMLLNHRSSLKTGRNSDGKADYTNEMLSALTPDRNPDGTPNHERRNGIVDKLLGIHGGRNANEMEDVSHPDHFAYDNWINGQDRGTPSQKEALASSKLLSPHQIDHIKRHGTDAEKYALFQNPHVDPKHAIEMFGHWTNDDDNKGYSLENFRDQIKNDPEFSYESMQDDLRDEAEDEAREEYPYQEFLDDHGSDDENWVNRNKFEQKFRQRNPGADDVEVDEAYREEVDDQKNQGYNEAIDDRAYPMMRHLYNKKMDDDDMHFSEEFLPSHLHGKLPNVEEAKARIRERKAKEAEEKAREEEEKAQPYLNEHMPQRDNSHPYGDNQHHLEMAKRFADANGGTIDVGQLHKMFPNLKDKWKSIFGSKGKMTSQELEQKINEIPKTPYAVSYKPWNKHQMQNINDQDQVVVRLDHTPESLAPLKQDPELFNTFSKIQDVSQRSGHPTNPNTIAWARVDTSNPKHWMIDEVQSDFGSAARDYLDDNGKSDEAQHVDKIVKYHKNWREALINKVLKLAQANGAEKVSTHSPESKAAHTGASTVHTVYKDSYQKVPRSMGFRPSHMNELPLSEEGRKTFQAGRADDSAADRINQHLAGAEYHAQLAQAHDLLADPGSDGFSIIGEEEKYHPNEAQIAMHHDHNVAHSKKFREHLDALSNIDPTHWAARTKTQPKFLQKYHAVLDSWGEPVDPQKFLNTGIMMGKQDVQHKMNGTLTGIPVPTMDSALSQQAPVEPHPGHTFDLTSVAAKKSIDEATDLMKKEVDQASRTKIAMTLRTIQDNQEALEQLKQTNPDAYTAITSMVDSLVKLFQDKTGQDVDSLMHELEIQEQLEEQQAQAQAQGQNPQQAPQDEGSVSVGGPRVDQPVHGSKLVFAPGAVRRYSSQDERIKGQDGDWSSFSGGLQEGDQGQSSE